MIDVRIVLGNWSEVEAIVDRRYTLKGLQCHRFHEIKIRPFYRIIHN